MHIADSLSVCGRELQIISEELLKREGAGLKDWAKPPNARGLRMAAPQNWETKRSRVHE